MKKYLLMLAMLMKGVALVAQGLPTDASLLLNIVFHLFGIVSLILMAHRWGNIIYTDGYLQ